MKDLSLTVLSPRKPKKRGKVTNFTSASRRRMIDLCARLAPSGYRSKFLTLTFSGYPTPTQAKKAFRKFLKRLARRCPRASAVWRVENQKRGSPHFHLIIFKMPYIKQSVYQRMWESCTGETKHAEKYRRFKIINNRKVVYRSRSRRYVKCSRVFICALKNHRMVMYYVAKYCAKKPLLDNGSYLTDFQIEWNGRHWGVHNRKGLPMAKREIAVIRDREIFDSFRDMAWIVSRGRTGESVLGAKLYTSNAKVIYEQTLAMSKDALLQDDYVQEIGFRYSRDCAKRVQRWFGIKP